MDAAANQTPRRGRPGNPDRRAAIADAIIALLADAGARGLTHRAVDLRAGLPPGTAVYHAPTRIDLLVMASQRITELGLAELDWLTTLIATHPVLTPEQVIDPLIATWRERLRPDRRKRARAEIAVALSASRDPAVESAYRAPQIFADIWTAVMARLGTRDPRTAALEFTGLIRGRFYHHVLNGEPFDERALRATLLAALRTLIALDLPDQAVSAAVGK